MDTNYFGLSRISTGQRFSTNSYKYTDADRQKIDLLLYRAFVHNHTGVGTTSEAPNVAPVLSLDTTVGSIPSGTRVYYKITHVDIHGHESPPSPESYLETPQPVQPPAAPTLTSAGGSLTFGNYFYVLSAYVSENTQETLAVNPSWITITGSGSITLTLPSVPTGADGFNIYRKRPGSKGYVWIDSVTSSESTYLDDGSVVEDANRTLPTSNSTNSTNSITLDYDSLPSETTWRIYRTYVSGQYTNSFLHHVVEETTEGSGIIATTYYDNGTGTFSQEPPAQGMVVPAPEKIDLADMAEVQNALPPAGVAAFPIVVEMSKAGTVSSGTNADYWVCNYESARIAGIRIATSSAPTTTDVIVDINKQTFGATPTGPSTIFSTQANRPTILVVATPTNTFSDVAIPDDINLSIDDVLYLDVDQGDAAAADLKVYVRLYVTHTSTDSTSPAWS